MAKRIFFPSIDEIIAFFADLALSIEKFTYSFVDQFIIAALDKFAQDIDDLQTGLDLVADALPLPDPELKRVVITAYDVAAALREYQQKELRKFLQGRYKQLLKDARSVYSTKLLVTAIKQLASLEWGTAVGFILTHVGSLIIGFGSAELLYQSLNTELLDRLTKNTLSQKNPRRSVDGPHRTRKSV